jgi:hypothetical protein
LRLLLFLVGEIEPYKVKIMVILSEAAEVAAEAVVEA